MNARRRILRWGGLVLSIEACAMDSGRGPVVSTVGDPPDLAAEEIAAEACATVERCGAVHVMCEGDECSGWIEPATEDDLSSCRHGQVALWTMLITELDTRGIPREDLDACVNAQLVEPCVTQDEVDAYVARLEAGEMLETFRPLPPECETVLVP